MLLLRDGRRWQRIRLACRLLSLVFLLDLPDRHRLSRPTLYSFAVGDENRLTNEES